MVDRFFTSDLHFGHKNIIGFCDRPWPDVDAMNEGLVDNWNATVRADDEVWILGDFAMGYLPQTLLFAKRLNGVKHLVPGNHDAPFNEHPKRAAQSFLYEADFIIEPEFVSFEKFDVCHFPYEMDMRHAGRYVALYPKRQDPERWLLHGHIHSGNPREMNNYQIDVGVDANQYKPVPEKFIEYLIGDQWKMRLF